MQLDPHLAAVTYACGGIMVSTIAVTGGLRMNSFRRALELQLAMRGEEIPAQIALYVSYNIKALHVTAGWFVLTVLADLAISRAAPHPWLAAAAGWLSVVGMLACGLMLMVFAASDFRIKINRLAYRVVQMTAGCCGLAVAVLGALMMVQFGKLWPALSA